MPRKVLIADDQESNRLILTQMLCGDYDILEASDGKQALEILRAQSGTVCAVLLDIVMPGMDGYETLRAIRSDIHISQTPVIMITANDDKESCVKSLVLGANDYVTKPYNVDILRHCLKNNIAFREAKVTAESSLRDKLTGLWNRESFFDRVAKRLEDDTENGYVLACLDVDNFKVINDRYGTEKGDEVLKTLADMIRRDCDSDGSICARIAADNFAVFYRKEILDERPGEQEKHEDSLTEEFPIPVTISIGRYIVTDRSLSVSAMYDRAKIAQATVKRRSDIHTATYDESMREKIIREQGIVGEMNGALSGGQFEPWFQPQYNHITGAMIGAEALVRWNHPERGLIPPDEFIPIFERNGFIYELDKFVWEEVCRYLRKWIDEGRNPLPVSVNISRFDALCPDLIEDIVTLTEKYAIDPSMLRLEITESAFAYDSDRIIGVVKEFIAKGFTIEIDDFGSGYSSLNTLKDVPAQILKLDMKFLQGGDSDRGGNIVESVVRMAKWLGMSVIAEGVETLGQADYLTSVGCNYLQGYFYARPMPAAMYEKHCKGNTKEERLIKLETVDSLDNNDFWNPRSLDSIIFNSFVGAACVFEYHAGRIEIIRATEMYAAMLGGKLSVTDLMTLNIGDYMSEESRARVDSLLTTSAHTYKQMTEELVFTGVPGYDYDIHIRCFMRVIATLSDRMLVYCINENVTEQRKAEREFYESDRQIRFLNEMSHELLAQPDTDAGIKSLLGKLLESFQANRAYIFENDASGETFSNTYEVCRPGVTEELPHLQNLPIYMLFYWYEHFDSEGFYIIPDIAALDDTRAQERKILSEQGISSLFAAPIRRDGKTIGIIGVDDPKRGTTQISHFAALGDYLAVIMTRRDLNAKIARDARAISDMVNDIPGGFAKLHLLPDGSMKTVFVNETLCRMRKMTKEEVYAADGDNSCDSVHPDDREAVENAVRDILSGTEVYNIQYRLRRKDGSYVPVNVFGRITRGDNGETNVNIYFTDMSEAERYKYELRDVMSRVLSAIMKSKTEYAFAKDNDFRYICCSPAFMRLAGVTSENDAIGKTDFELFPADMAKQFRDNDVALLEGGDPIVDFYETITEHDGSLRYCRASKYVLRDENGSIIGIYGVSRDITEERSAYAQLKLLTDSIPGGIAVYNGNPDELDKIRLSYFSDGFCRIFGYTRQEYEKLAAVNPLGLVSPTDLGTVYSKVAGLVRNGEPMDFVYKAYTKDGSLRWINVKAVLGENLGSDMTVNAVFIDVTDERAAMEQLRISEEENAFAVRHGGNIVCRYSVSDKTLTVESYGSEPGNTRRKITCVPDEPVNAGSISPETKDAYIAFFEDINRGKKTGTVLFQEKHNDAWRWMEAKSSTLFDDEGKPIKAVISMFDVSDRVEKEAVYKRWKQSLENMTPESHTLFRLNLNSDRIFEAKDGDLITHDFSDDTKSINERAVEYAKECVFDDDTERYTTLVNRDTLISDYYLGKRTDSIEYRELLPNDRVRWLKLTIDLVESADSNDVEAFFLYEDIDKAKREELRTRELAETDPLTGILNRSSFALRMNDILASSKPGTIHALLMIDIDDFKRVNDVFGHGMGDQVLINVTQRLSACVRGNDLVGRLAGDEFLVFLNNIHQEEDATEKAKQICSLIRKSYSLEIQVTGSVGVVIAPKYGNDFSTLYGKVDSALYNIKDSGKNSVAVYNETMADGHARNESDDILPERKKGARRRRMLIVDDNTIDYDMMQSIFRDDFIIEKANDGETALARLRYYGSAISVVLLDLMMPGMDGFEVLKRMQESELLSTIPTVIVSGDESRESCLKAIREGATDFITKPVDPDILRLRVVSAISKAENERLRAKNALLEVQNEERVRYDYVLERVGITFIEYNRHTHEFVYFPSLTQYLAGKYDDRPFWTILLSDMVADTETVKKMQQLVHAVATERGRKNGGSISVKLKTPQNEPHMFRMNVHKQPDESHLNGKILITLTDLDFTVE